jgi:hypothetical protein
MRRVLFYYKWREQWWINQGSQRHDTRSDIQEGLQAYAAKQGRIMSQLAQQFADQWYPGLMKRGLPVDWPEDLQKKGHEVDMMESNMRDWSDTEGGTEMEEDIFD